MRPVRAPHAPHITCPVRSRASPLRLLHPQLVLRNCNVLKLETKRFSLAVTSHESRADWRSCTPHGSASKLILLLVSSHTSGTQHNNVMVLFRPPAPVACLSPELSSALERLRDDEHATSRRARAPHDMKRIADHGPHRSRRAGTHADGGGRRLASLPSSRRDESRRRGRRPAARRARMAARHRPARPSSIPLHTARAHWQRACPHIATASTASSR
jgi:hypothetical protein